MKRLTSRMMHAPLAQPTTTSNSNPIGQTPHPDDPTAPTSTVAAAVAYEAMIEALRDNIDPLMVEVQTDTGLYLRIIQCTIRTIVDGQTMSIFELLKQASYGSPRRDTRPARGNREP